MKIALTANNPTDEHIETQNFRMLVRAFGYPARIVDMGTPALEAMLVAICDEKSPVALEGQAKRALAIAQARHIPLLPPAQADFTFTDAASLRWNDLPIGTKQAPEEGATTIIEVSELSACCGAVQVIVRGAGIKENASFWIDQLTADCLSQRPAYSYPCGTDLILICGSNIIALPRHLHWEIL